jgi:O-antigen ligase
MTSSSVFAAKLRQVESVEAKSVPSASLLFVATATVLITATYLMPISESWNRSTFEHYTDEENFTAAANDGTLSHQIAFASLGLFGLAAAAWPGGRPLGIRGTLGMLCVAYLAWCTLSTLWSDSFSMSLRRFIALMCEVAAGVAIAKRASPRQYVWIAFACSLGWLCLGVLAELSLGTFRPWQSGYRFSGVFHPNDMGVSCALLALSSIYLAGGKWRGSRALYAVAAIAFIFLLLTGSRTAVSALVLSFALWWIVTTPASKVLFYSVGVAAIAAYLAVLIIGFGSSEVTENVVAMGRTDDTTSLTGRGPLWEDLFDNYVPQRALIGYGYGSFWSADHIAEVSKSQAWAVQSTHSSYLDLLLNVGLVGAVLCLSAMALACFKALKFELREPHAGYGFIAMVVIYGLIGGLGETTIGINWHLALFGICAVSYIVLGGAPKSQKVSADLLSPRPRSKPTINRGKAIA